MPRAAATVPRALLRFLQPAGITVVGMFIGVLTGCSSGGSGHLGPGRDAGGGRTAGAQSYGPLPTFLPSATLRPDGVLTGAVARPAVTSEGDAVRVQVVSGSVLATVTGPQVPVQGMAQQPETATCTWIVTLTRVSGRVPVSVADFSVIDEEGFRSSPWLMPGTARPPTAATPERTVRFELRDVIRAGAGVVVWSPGGRRVASWDFVAETD